MNARRDMNATSPVRITIVRARMVVSVRATLDHLCPKAASSPGRGPRILS